MLRLSVFPTAFSILLLNACGSAVQQQNHAASVQRSSGDVSAGRCRVGSLSAEMSSKGFELIDINGLKVQTHDGASRTLCDLAMDYDHDVVTLQFSGVTCLSCQKEGQYFNNELTLSLGSKIGHVVALTDFLEDFTESEFEGFMTKYAPKSLRMHDPKIELWKYFSANPSEPTRPTIVAYKRDGLAFVVNEDGVSPTVALNAAQVLAELKSADSEIKVDPIKEVDPENPPTSGDTPGKAISLSSSQNFTFKDSTGKQTTLKDFFGEADYVSIDLSQYNCAPCQNLATSHQRDTSFQALFSGAKCKALTLVPSRDLSSWLSKYPSTTFVGKNSRGVDSESSVANAFRVNFVGTPTVFVVNRKGELVAEEVGAVPTELNNVCK